MGNIDFDWGRTPASEKDKEACEKAIRSVAEQNQAFAEKFDQVKIKGSAHASTNDFKTHYRADLLKKKDQGGLEHVEIIHVYPDDVQISLKLNSSLSALITNQEHVDADHVHAHLKPQGSANKASDQGGGKDS